MTTKKRMTTPKSVMKKVWPSSLSLDFWYTFSYAPVTAWRISQQMGMMRMPSQKLGVTKECVMRSQ